jgi:metal-dependent amidase/aminoacylase/carboxypeptidase family protein
MKLQKGWKVKPSAYGIETAFIAEFDSGEKGSVISYNAEYGMYLAWEDKQAD